MSPISPHDPLDDLIAAALHGDLSPEERAQFELRLQNDPAARAAYQETQTMHDLLEKNHRDAQPDPAFEERMVSGVRRKIQEETHHETAWESLVFLWQWVKRCLSFNRRLTYVEWACAAFAVLIMAGVTFGPITNGIKKSREFTSLKGHVGTAKRGITLNGYVDTNSTYQFAGAALPSSFEKAISGSGGLPKAGELQSHHTADGIQAQDAQLQQETVAPRAVFAAGSTEAIASTDASAPKAAPAFAVNETSPTAPVGAQTTPSPVTEKDSLRAREFTDQVDLAAAQADYTKAAKKPMNTPATPAATTPPTTVVATQPSLKLIRNAQLDLEVKSFQPAIDEIGALTKTAGGYVDSSNSQKGGNGKLQGTVVVKVLPQNLDSFLLKLRDLGMVENQSVSAENVTKEYYDTQARLDNARRMEVQLQDLLKHENSKVSDLLQVERELARVRGDIEQMQGQLKLYDFQVQFATVTIQLKEKDLNQTAAYLLKEQDDFSLFAVDVEGTFKQARAAADRFKAQVLQANLRHNSGSDISADLVVRVAPDQIDSFLSVVRTLGRLDNFTRQTQRVAKDGGDSDQPADETRTDKDSVQVHVTIRSDDESRKQAALTVVASAVDEALDKAKAAALANAGVEIISSSLNKTPQGQATAQLSVRVPGKDYHALLDSFRALGHASSFSLQRDDNSGPGANGDDAPVILSLTLTNDETPLQQTEMSVLVSDVESRAQSIKKQAITSGVEVKDSNFERQPDGAEMAQLRFRLPLSKYPAFLESLKNLGKVESLTVQRQDRPAQTTTDDDALVEIGLKIHNQGDVIPDNTGLWATIRQTFGQGAGALFASVKTIGVMIAFLAPWLVTLALLAWAGRRIYVRRKK